MHGILPTELWVFGLLIGSTFFWTQGGCDSTTENISVNPVTQQAVQNQHVVIHCHSRTGPVEWKRKDGKSLPRHAYQQHGSLHFNKIKYSDRGIYICSNSEHQFKEAFVEVVRSSSTSVYITNKTVLTTPQPAFSTPRIFTTPNPCQYGVCNGTCCEPWSPKIIKLPKLKVEIFCGDQETDKSETLTLECEAVGFPVPLIKWKKYEGHVPTKCRQSSKDGRGVLTCPDFQQSDQGAYSCIAENSVKSSESQPKSVAKCSNVIQCKGFKVLNEDQIENCLECYCSGKTSQCQSIASNLTVHRIPFPEAKTEIFAEKNGEIVFIPLDSQIAPNDKVRKSAQGITYCSLFENGFKEISLLKSYGRNINIPRHKGKTDFLPEAPDLIIRGDGVSLMYTFNIISPSAESVNVRFWPGNWHHLNKTVATRQDLMKVLSNADAILLRCEYEQGKTVNWDSKIRILLESSTISNFSSSVSYVEKCHCPPGYDGLSCESCASGYSRKAQGNDFICERKYPLTCDLGWKGSKCDECDSSKGYFKLNNTCMKSTCDPDGSITPLPNVLGKCSCRDGVTGDSCQKCEKGFFSIKKPRGCLKCWCSGVTNQCNSARLYKSVISRNPYGGYNSSDGRNFWLLPSDFNGNRLTSYGGHLNYTLKYKPNLPIQNSILTVELLSVDDVTLTYTHPNIDHKLTSNEKSWVVPLNEKDWRKADKSTVTRGEFLSVLSKIKAIYIESPYHLSSGNANLTSTRLSSTSTWQDGDSELAADVEQCNCPRGHTGLSCESCSEGYYRKKTGNVTLCVKCNCTHCDPELGCLDCSPGTYRDNPMEEEKAVCKACPCNGNGKACVKDDYGQIICMCKPGFTGMYCEKRIPSSKESDFTVRIHPRRIKGKKVGAVVLLNCSYSSSEEMTITAKKTYTSGAQISIENTYNNSVSASTGKERIFEVVLDNNIEFVDCYVHDAQGNEAGHIRGVIEDLVTVVKPVKITNCYSDRIDVKEGESKDIICEAVGMPVPMVNWYITNKDMTTEKVDTTEGVHSIGSTSLQQNGTIYTCIAENSEGDRKTCTKVLIVKKKCDVVNINKKKLRIEEGKTIKLGCKTTVKSPVSWSILSDSSIKRSLPARAKVQNGVLEIVNATVSDSGIYVCEANATDGKISDNSSVIVEEKKIFPTVSIPQGDVKLNIDDTYEISCLATGKPIPTISWTKVGSEKLPKNIKLEAQGKEKLSLTISNATVENSGLYKCESRSTLGSETAFILIKVKDNRIIPKVKITPSGDVEQIEGSKLKMECVVVQGYPSPAVTWFKFERDQWVETARGSVLEFQNLSRDNRGVYKCEGQNLAGIGEASVDIGVRIPPRVNISEESIVAHEGESVTLTCLSFGYPQPTITWLTFPKLDFNIIDTSYNDKILIEPLESIEEKISFKVPPDADGLSISCLTENSAGSANKTAKLKVLQAEDKYSEETVERVQIGSYFELNCGFSAENVSWEKVGGFVGDECFIPNGLMIVSVQVQHNGTYICRCNSQIDKNCGKSINLIVVGFVPKFSRQSKSYMVVPASLKSSNGLHIEMSFVSKEGNGILLQKSSDDLDIYIKKKAVHLSLYSREGDFLDVVTNKAIEPMMWYSLSITVTETYVDITIYDNTTSSFSRKTEYFENFKINFSSNMNDSFFVGRTNSNMRHPRKMFLSRMPSFDGCISRLNIDHHEFDIIKEASYSHNVTLCKRCSDEENPCQERGKCLDAPTQYGFICVCPTEYEKNKNLTCPASCSGRGCETQLDLCSLLNPCRRRDLHRCSHNRYSFQCDCAYGYSGTTCEKVRDHSFCVKENGYVRLPSYLLDRRSLAVPEVIKMAFTLYKPDGMLLWQGDKINHLFIAVRQGKLEYVYWNQNRKLTVVSPGTLELNKKHTVEITRRNNTVAVEFNKTTYESATEFTTNRVSGDIYLGNVPTSMSGRTVGLNGCIHYIAFGDKPKISLHETELERLNDYKLPTQYQNSSEEADESESSRDGDYSYP